MNNEPGMRSTVHNESNPMSAGMEKGGEGLGKKVMVGLYSKVGVGSVYFYTSLFVKGSFHFCWMDNCSW
jgi:hypothetical protein